MVYAFFISAGTFEDGRKLANKYMQENFEDGYEYDVSAGGTNLCNSSSYIASFGKFVISNVIDDIKCFFKVKEKEYKIMFNANGVGVIDENTKITEAYKYKDSKGNDSYYIVSSSGSGWVLKAFYNYKEDANKNDKPNADNNKITDDNNAVIWIVCSIICVLVIIAIIFVVKKNKKEIQNKD